ncbi:MAG: pyridoxamine 5'-phosphate oxidase family protein [Burkholderiales bacterium]|nr:pyridoxamine 5'-phosphate oxidase family protein [Burkholderiales bacterium]
MSSPNLPTDPSPFHPDEQALQARLGMRDRIEQVGRRLIRDSMPDQHRAFFAELPFVVIGALDDRDRPWASLLAGPPGFVRAPDPRSLIVGARPAAGEPIGAALAPGAPVGLLGIQPETRRRNRLNGIVSSAHAQGFAVQVQQSFGNCPQYIQARAPASLPGAAVAPRVARSEGARLSSDAANLVRAADTFFIASASSEARSGKPAYGVDVSHRGGKPGFVRVTEEGGRSVLAAPDFAGNKFFNTLGNLLRNPHAGLAFVDFAAGRLLSLTGEAEVIWEGPELAAYAGAERLLVFRAREGVWIEDALAMRWSAPQWAPQLARTGSWEDVERAIKA